MNFRASAGLISCVVLGLSASCQTVQVPVVWTGKVAVYGRLAWDSNIYGQMEDAPTQVGFTEGSPPAELGSIVATSGAQFDFGWRAASWLNVQGTYNPEATWYEAAEEESFIAHRLGLALSGRGGDTEGEWRSSAFLVDGAKGGLVWSRVGGFHATAATLPRDRRDQALYRSQVRVTHRAGPWRVRAVGSVFRQDFQTRLSTSTGYGNYVDRSDRSVGVDVGHRIGESWDIYVGHRFGRLIQANTPGTALNFSNSYHRIVLGLEGTFAPGWKTVVSVGPDFRHYGGTLPSRLSRRETLMFVDATVSGSPTPRDGVRVTVQRALAASSGGAALYEETKLEAAWKHEVASRWHLELTGSVSEADYEPWASAPRDDWTYRVLAGVAGEVWRGLRAEASVLWDFGRGDIPGKPARDYDRCVSTLGVRREW